MVGDTPILIQFLLLSPFYPVFEIIQLIASQ